MEQLQINKYNEWNKRRILTPTFQLAPLEKPDMSPYLVHMTGKGSLVNILKGEGSAAQRRGYGFLKSNIPVYNGTQIYNSPVVCFTETPIFALDFFRFRSKGRWMDDQQYGIGFSKEKLILQHGVRPVICLDTQTNSQLLNLCNKAETDSQRFAEDEVDHIHTRNVLAKLKPLLFPMLETSELQGFMWEREWRMPSPDGLNFGHDLIEVICCPQEEQEEILKLLGPAKSNVRMIESWKEYDELTTFLKERQAIIDAFDPEHVYDMTDIPQLLARQKEVLEMMQSLSTYQTVFRGKAEEGQTSTIDRMIEKMMDYHYHLEQQLEATRYYQSEEFEQVYNAWELSQGYEQ